MSFLVCESQSWLPGQLCFNGHSTLLVLQAASLQDYSQLSGVVLGAAADQLLKVIWVHTQQGEQSVTKVVRLPNGFISSLCCLYLLKVTADCPV